MTSEQTVTRESEIQETSPVLSIENLRKTFDEGDIIAAENINVDIHEKDFVVLLGPSGCGKTTILRSIAGLEIPDQGQIFIRGEEATNLKPKDRNLAFVFQNIALFPHKSVRGNIQFGLDMATDLSSEEKRERTEDAAKMLGIEDLLDRKPSELSGGQQQRVSLGRAMVMEPAAFLLDEPFSALDRNLRDRMQTEVKQLQRRLERPMIFVTHDQEEAMTLGDKIIILKKGNIQQQGSPYDIYNEPANRFVAEFIGSPKTNLLKATVQIKGDDVIIITDPFSLTLTDEQASSIQIEDKEPVTLGIRPEYIEVNADTPRFMAELNVVEPTGDRDSIFLDADGTEIRAKAVQGKIDQNRTQIGLDLEPDDIWIFDEDGERII